MILCLRRCGLRIPLTPRSAASRRLQHNTHQHFGGCAQSGNYATCGHCTIKEVPCAQVASAVQTGSDGSPAAAANGATSSQQAMWGSAAPRQTAAAEPLAATETADATAAAGAATGTSTAAAVPITAAAAEAPPSEATQEATPEQLAQWHADAERCDVLLRCGAEGDSWGCGADRQRRASHVVRPALNMAAFVKS